MHSNSIVLHPSRFNSPIKCVSNKLKPYFIVNSKFPKTNQNCISNSKRSGHYSSVDIEMLPSKKMLIINQWLTDKANEMVSGAH